MAMNIVLSGGGSTLPGLPERLYQEYAGMAGGSGIRTRAGSGQGF